jgi:hypothetical protein
MISKFGTAPLDGDQLDAKLLLRGTTEYRKTRTNIHVSSGIRTHDSGIQAVKPHALDHTDYFISVMF